MTSFGIWTGPRAAQIGDGKNQDLHVRAEVLLDLYLSCNVSFG